MCSALCGVCMCALRNYVIDLVNEYPGGVPCPRQIAKKWEFFQVVISLAQNPI